MLAVVNKSKKAVPTLRFNDGGGNFPTSIPSVGFTSQVFPKRRGGKQLEKLGLCKVSCERGLQPAPISRTNKYESGKFFLSKPVNNAISERRCNAKSWGIQKGSEMIYESALPFFHLMASLFEPISQYRYHTGKLVEVSTSCSLAFVAAAAAIGLTMPHLGSIT